MRIANFANHANYVQFANSHDSLIRYFATFIAILQCDDLRLLTSSFRSGDGDDVGCLHAGENAIQLRGGDVSIERPIQVGGGA